MSARDDLAAQQTELLSSLLAGTAPPPGFDTRWVAAAAMSLRAKRERVIARLRPDLPDALGARFSVLCAEYVAEHPRRDGIRSHQDADSFARWLIDRGELPRRRLRRRRR